MNIEILTNKIYEGYKISKKEALELINCNLKELSYYANEIRKKFCGNSFDICSIINAKSGACSEDCKYCAQSKFYNVNCEKYKILKKEEILDGALQNQKNGLLRYSVVTSGKKLSEKEIDLICEAYKTINKQCEISTCASHGLLSYEQLKKLKQSGVCRYHNNLETSRKNFPNICTTHTYDEKIATIKNAQKAGLEVCSGGIMGLGENMEDRIDMALDLRKLNVKSVPINILNPIKGTPFEKNKKLSFDEIIRIIAIFRFILPENVIRLAGGRGLLDDKGKLAFQSGANAAISGHMLTTSGINTKQDLEIIDKLGFKKEKM